MRSKLPFMPGIAKGLVLITSTLAIAASGMSSASATRVVKLDADSVQPATLVVHLGDALRWHNRDTRPHRVVSDPSGLFRTDRIAPRDTSERLFFDSAGTFPYSVANDSAVRGAVRVPIKLRPGPNVSPTPGTLITLRVGTEQRSNLVYDIQRKRNKGRWVFLTKRTHQVRFRLRLKTTGTFWFRARVTNVGVGVRSHWSPPRKELLNTPPP
jgi:plastocyanin